MKKGEFTLYDSHKTPMRLVEGWVTDNFGIFNDGLSYQTIHLKTGSRIYFFERLVQAKRFVEALEKRKFPVAWDRITLDNIDQAEQNEAKAAEIRDKVILENP